jgi:hypothetical protein
MLNGRLRVRSTLESHVRVPFIYVAYLNLDNGMGVQPWKTSMPTGAFSFLFWVALGPRTYWAGVLSLKPWSEPFLLCFSR